MTPKTEYAIVDPSCNCRRIVRSLKLALEIAQGGELMPGRPAGAPLKVERREVSEWEPVE